MRHYPLLLLFCLVVFFFNFSNLKEIIKVSNDKPGYSYQYNNSAFNKSYTEIYDKMFGLRRFAYIPDVMNNINVLEINDNIKNYYTVNLDSFPVFNGFPTQGDGHSQEGCIFCNMDTDSDLEILCNIGIKVHAWNLDGSNVNGWPKILSSINRSLYGAPAFGDIDGDGVGEIVVNSRWNDVGSIYAFEKDGSDVEGFPILQNGRPSESPTLGDIDNNGTDEIIVGKRMYPVGEYCVYKGDGTMYPGWPKQIDDVPASSAAVGDITGDGIPEIVAESYSSIYVWKNNGDLLPGFPFNLSNGDGNSYSAPILADVDYDNKREIVFGTHKVGGGGYVYILKNNGTIMPSWPKHTQYWIYSPPAIGYIDNDTIIDIAVGDKVGSSFPHNYVYAWNKNGTTLSGFPIGPLEAIHSQIILGDIDNDNMTELIIDNNTQYSGIWGKYHAFNHDGTPVPGWPITTVGYTMAQTPCLTDINRDGILDIIGSGYDIPTGYTNVYIWNTGMNYNPNNIIIPMFQYNEKHNGVYDDPTLIGIKKQQTVITSDYRLYQNYPNPFNPNTKIKFDVPSSSFVKITVYNILGKEITTLINKKLSAGSYAVDWNGSSYPSGVYFYKLVADDYVDIKNMLLLK